MQIIKKSLDDFFRGDMQVAVVKGKWGVGKTYFWDNYINEQIKSSKCKQIAYSYISLFGKSNLSDIKQSIFQTSKLIKKESEIFNRLPWIKSAIKASKNKVLLLGWLTKLSKDAPIIKQYAPLISSFEYGMVNNYIICIDDIERKSESLSIKEVMGIVDELAQRKSCKVVLVFNEQSLDNDKDKKDFEIYREKVVDIELNYNPTHDRNLQCVIDCNAEYYSKLLYLVKELNIKNIRVIKKIKWVLDELWEFVKGKEQRLVDEFLTHISLLCWSYYKSEDALPFELVYDRLRSNSWLSIFSQEEKDDDASTQKYKSIATNLSLRSAIYDEEISDLLKCGFVDKDEFREKIAKLSRNIEVDIVSDSLHRAWGIYMGSFSNNLNKFKSALHSILSSDLDKIKLNDFSSVIDVLEEYGENVTDYIDKYIKIHEETLKNDNIRDSWAMERIKHPVLVEKINEICEQPDDMCIDEVTLKIATNSNFNPEDIKFLSSLSSDDYFKWMMGTPDDMTKKIKDGLLKLNYIQASNEENKRKYGGIAINVIEALKKIAGTNEFNRKRVKYIYKVEI